MKKLVLVGILFAVLIALSAAQADTWLTSALSNFNEGTYYQTSYGVDAVKLNPGEISGTYTSKIFDAGSIIKWNKISWSGLSNMAGNKLWLRLDDGASATTFADASGNGNDGSCSGGTCPTWSSGKFGGSFEFDGVDDYITVPDSNILDISNEITISGWFYPMSVPTGYAAHIMSKWSDTPDANFVLYYFGTTSGEPAGKIAFIGNAGGSWQTLSDMYTIPLDTWTFVTWTYTSTGGGILYINGAPLSQTGTGSGALATNNQPLLIGGFPANPKFNGLVDEAAIYDRALSATEILEQYTTGATHLKLSARSCNDAACSGESWVDIGGNFLENLNIDNNQYFQYKCSFETQDSAAVRPELSSVKVAYDEHPNLTYIGKVGPTLDVNSHEKGTEDNSFNFDSQNNWISAQFHRDGEWNAWYYTLSSELTSDVNFFARFDFTSPAGWAYTQTQGSGSANPYIFFGFMNTANPNAGWTDEVALQISDYETGMDIESWIMGHNALYASGTDTSHMIPTSTDCYVTLSYDAATKQLTVKLYESEILAKTYVSTLGNGDSFTEDAIGLYTFTPNDGNYAYLTNPFKVTKIMVNTGVTEESFKFGLKPSSSYDFELADGTDVTVEGQTGVKTVYAWNTIVGKYVGALDIDFSAPSETIELPSITSATDAVEGKAIFHNTEAYPSEVTNWWLMVPKTIGSPYHCPSATALNEVTLSCLGIDLSPIYTEVSLGGNTYYKMNNQGGGNGGGPGGGSVPEFSDFAWVLAAVLGAGSFGLIRMRKK